MATTNPTVSSSSQDLVGIFRQDDYQQLFETANPMQVNVREMAKLLGYEAEDGVEISDHIIYLPVEIDLPFIVTDGTREVFANMQAAFRAHAKVIVQTKVATYRDQIIYEIPHGEVAEQGNSITVQIKLREVLIVTPEYGALPPRKVTNKSQASTVKKGSQQTSESDAPTKRKASVLAGLF